MPNAIGTTGLTIATQAELVADFTTAFQEIYGADIDLSSNSPDGQMMNIFIQAILDALELVLQVYNMFDPDNAIGVVLDQRAAINGVVRQVGTYTTTPITVVVSQSVNLYGLDQTAQDIFTISDAAGNQWQLVTTVLGVTIGTHSYSFRSATPGANTTVPNTINVPVTIILGVTSVNNPTTYTTLGVNEESDAAFKVRRLQSVGLASVGFLAGLRAALRAIPGVTSAFVYQNITATTNADGVPSHSIWVIVAGSGASADIANAVYTKRNAGCGMYGSTSAIVTQADGTPFTVYWDVVVTRNVFISFTATSLDGVTAPLIATIRAGLVTSLVPAVNQEVNINQLGTLVQALDPNCLVTASGFSLAQTQIATLSGVAASGAFVIGYNGNNTASIAWNDSVTTIQSKLQAVTGLSAATVTGSIASQTLTFVVPAGVLALLIVPTNTMATAGAAVITFAWNEGYTNTLSTASKQNQLVVTSANIIILPMILSPVTSTIASPLTQTMTGLGGYGTLVYSLSINNSGGSINASSGLYTSGVTRNVTDTIFVTDAMGNTATATVQVI